MDKSIFIVKRKNYIDIGEIFFWTATINKWQRLLEKDTFKNVIISSLEYLSNVGKIDVFGFVVMPNHIHLIWRTIEMNGKETAQASFLKFTAHEFKKMLKKESGGKLAMYQVGAANKKYEFWQRDSLAIHLYTKEVAYQKLDYLHYNPCAEHWQLVSDPCQYVYSTAKFFMMGENNYSFLKNLRDEF